MDDELSFLWAVGSFVVNPKPARVAFRLRNLNFGRRRLPRLRTLRSIAWVQKCHITAEGPRGECGAGFLDSIAALKVSNFMVVAIDKALADNLQKQGVPYYFKHNNAQGNHGVSAQKFGIIRCAPGLQLFLQMELN
jgi:hypothetical protein